MSTTSELNISNILMWIFVILIVIGLILTFRTLHTGNNFIHRFEGPVVIVIGLVASVVTGVMSSKKLSEGFKESLGI